MPTNSSPNKATLASVAQEAGVAASTASLILNDKASTVGLAAGTILHVKRVAEKLGYTPNQNARSLRMRRSGMLGVILSGIPNMIPTQLLAGTRNVLDRSGQDMSPLLTSHEYDSEREHKELRFLARNQVEAVIATPMGPYERNYAPLVAAGIPVIFAMHGLADAPPEASGIYLDSSANSRIGIEHLAQGGARRIAYLAWDFGTLMSSEKLAGVQKGMQEVKSDSSLAGIFIQQPNTSFEASLDAIFSNARNRPDALLCNPFQVAINCLDYLDRKRISVPNECALLSLNDNPVFEMERISISAIAQDTEFIGRRATEVALDQIAARRPQVVREFYSPFSVVTRGTTRSVRS